MRNSTKSLAAVLAAATLTGGLTAPATVMAAETPDTDTPKASEEAKDDLTLSMSMGGATYDFTRGPDAWTLTRPASDFNGQVPKKTELKFTVTSTDENGGIVQHTYGFTTKTKGKVDGDTGSFDVTYTSRALSGDGSKGLPVRLTVTGFHEPVDTTDLDGAIKAGETTLADGTWRTAASEKTLKDAISAAEQVKSQAGSIGVNPVKKAVAAINDAIQGLIPVTFDVTVDGHGIGTVDSQGVFTASGHAYEDIPGDKATVTPTAKDTGVAAFDIPLHAVGQARATDATLGRVTVIGRASGTQAIADHKPITVTVNYMDVQGQDVSAPGVREFTRDEAGVYAGALGATLNSHNTPMLDGARLDRLTGPDGAAHDLTWSDAKATKPDDENQVTAVQRTAQAGGIVNVAWKAFGGQTGTNQQSWRIDATATRTRDTHLNARLLRVRADGSTAVQAVTGDTVTLGADAATDHYSLVFDKGPDAETPKVTVTTRPGSTDRVFHWTDNDGRARTLTLRFRQAPVSADSAAKLQGIYVNYSGKAVKGKLIDGWNPNRLSYVLSIGEKDPSPYILPVGSKGVTVAATDVKQTPDGASQTWTVTAKVNGVKRDYTVTVIRARAWQTADEKFIPAEPAMMDGTVDAKASETTLQSVGWTRDGKYTPAASGTYTIPEGGVFAYQPRRGQTATVSQTRLHGTTWRYTVGVLAPDGDAWREYSYDVTYITEATHTARLTGLKVDGRNVKGFNPSKTTYTANVADTDEWVVSPAYDRHSGMTVDTRKNGAKADITVTSADGLVKTVYHVTVKESALARAERNGLAKTGLAGGIIGLGLAAAAGLGMAVDRLTRREH